MVLFIFYFVDCSAFIVLFLFMFMFGLWDGSDGVDFFGWMWVGIGVIIYLFGS